MKILPAEGTDVITFGMTRHQVVERLGQPANATRLGDLPGYPRNRESLDYCGLSVLLTPGDGVISIDVDPSVAVWMPNPLPYGQKLISTFLEARSSAAIGPSLRSRLGNVGKDGIDVLSRDCLIRYVIAEQKLR